MPFFGFQLYKVFYKDYKLLPFKKVKTVKFKKRQRTSSAMVAELEAIVQEESIGSPQLPEALNDHDYNQYVHHYTEKQAVKSGTTYDLFKDVFRKRLRTEFKLDVLSNILSNYTIKDAEQLSYMETALAELKDQEKKGYLGRVLKGKGYQVSRKSRSQDTREKLDNVYALLNSRIKGYASTTTKQDIVFKAPEQFHAYGNGFMPQHVAKSTLYDGDKGVAKIIDGTPSVPVAMRTETELAGKNPKLEKQLNREVDLFYKGKEVESMTELMHTRLSLWDKVKHTYQNLMTSLFHKPYYFAVKNGTMDDLMLQVKAFYPGEQMEIASMGTQIDEQGNTTYSLVGREPSKVYVTKRTYDLPSRNSEPAKFPFMWKFQTA